MKILVLTECKKDSNIWNFGEIISRRLIDIYDFGKYNCTVSTEGFLYDFSNNKELHYECRIFIESEKGLFDINILNREDRKLAYYLKRYIYKNDFFLLDTDVNEDEPDRIVSSLKDTIDDLIKNKPKLFISGPLDEYYPILFKIAEYKFGMKFDLIDTVIEEEPPKNIKNDLSWAFGKRLELLGEADYFIGICDFPKYFCNCVVENAVAKHNDIKSIYVSDRLFKKYSFTIKDLEEMLDKHPNYIDLFIKTNDKEK